MPEILLTDSYLDARTTLCQVLREFIELPETLPRYGSFQFQGTNWSLLTATHTYQQHIYVFQYSDEELGKQALAHMESLLLWHYSDFSTESQGLVFMDREHEGQWAWEQAVKEGNSPYLIWTYQEFAPEQALAWERCSQAYQSENLEIRVCRNLLDFRVLCGAAQDFDPCISYVVSGLASLGGLRRVFRSLAKRNSDLHKFVSLGQQCGWAYGWIWGGGHDEYHGTLWARQPELSRQLEGTSGIRTLGRF